MKSKSPSIVSELRSLDLNLLVTLRALLDERHVSRAAEKSGLSQPGMSRALLRLRSMFNDPLLVKLEHGYELTPRAVAIDFALRKVLFDIQNIVAPPTFDPALAKGDFRIVALDYELVTMLPKIVPRIRKEAPGITVWTIAPTMNAQEGLDFGPLVNGDVHLILTAFKKTHSGLYQQRLLDEVSVCVAAVDHPEVQHSATLEELGKLEHVWVNITGPDPGVINESLALHGISREIKVFVPSFSLAAHTVAHTELISILPRRIVMPLVEAGLVSIIDIPVVISPFYVYQYWHERFNKDPQHVWFRKLVLEVARTLS
jgi:DNA-binding transcriptional LysR family regulator